ncbi:MAG: hypothetical protein SFX73_05615 [Kofleriaceae bacterium]|nr:hypothetical protein [Kofleriaceae bacterium]
MRASPGVGSILVHIDVDGDRPHPSSLTALATGRSLASSWGATLYAALIVHEGGERRAPESTAQVMAPTRVPGLEAIQGELAGAGADKIVVALTDTPVLPLWAAVGGAWQSVLDHLRPRLVMFGADAPSTPELGPRTGARIGGRLFVRARASGADLRELRDREGSFLRIGDGGAAVALIGGRTLPGEPREEDVDLVVLVTPSGTDARLELAGTTPAEPGHALGAVVAIGADAAADPDVVADATKLAAIVDAPVLRPSGTRADKHAASSAELVVAIGATQLEPSGASRVIRIGDAPSRQIDGALPEPIAPMLAELIRALESRS